jgi:hypothetical protein
MVCDLGINQAILKEKMLLLLHYRRSRSVDFDDYEIIEYEGECITKNTWDIFSKNADASNRIFEYLTADRVSRNPSQTSVNVIAAENILQLGAN